MRIGSLFSGIGGLELGLEWAGVGHTVWQVEQDPYCLRVLARHWPNAERFTDVREVGAHNLPRVDVICGGFPCQDISDAGKRAGIDGARSGLWSEYARIVREVRPRFVVVENVRPLLVRGIDRVLGDMAAAGYDAEWDVLSAAGVGAPHLRERVFIIAHVADTTSDGRSSIGAGSGRQRTEAPARIGMGAQPLGSGSGGGTQAVADAQRWRLTGDGQHRNTEPAHASARGAINARRWWATEPDVGRVAHGVPARVDRLRALGNAVVPQCAEVVGRRLLEIAAQHGASVAAQSAAGAVG